MFLNFYVSFFSYPLKLKLKDSFALMSRNKRDQRHQTEQSAGREKKERLQMFGFYNEKFLIFFLQKSYKLLLILPIRDMA